MPIVGTAAKVSEFSPAHPLRRNVYASARRRKNDIMNRLESTLFSNTKETWRKGDGLGCRMLNTKG